jgi:hypothetical protein
MKCSAIATTLLVCVSAAMNAQAADRQQVAGTVFGTDKSQSLEVGKQHNFVAIVSSETIVFDALGDDHPLQNLSGTCSGSVETKDGVSKGGGYCIYKNLKGGKWLLTWDVDAGKGDQGSYRLSGTEGNALGWKGAGTWGQSRDFGEQHYVQRWVGWVEKP